MLQWRDEINTKEMTTDLIYFTLNTSEYFVIKLPHGIEEGIHLCDEVEIEFHEDKKVYKLYLDCIQEALMSLKNLLHKAIGGELHLHTSITKNLGYLWNEECQGDNPNLFCETSLGWPRWVGLDYHLWSTPGNFDPILTTWIYNKEDKIVLEITPSYPWHFRDPKEGENFITYDVFMNDYKPLLVREIDKGVARDWLSKCLELLQMIENQQLSPQ